MAMQVGQSVVVRGRGLGTVVAVRDGMIVVAERDLEAGEESQFEIPVERAGDAIRAVATLEEAERALALVATRPERLPAAERGIAYRRAVKRGDLDEQARMLATMYGGPSEAPERQYQDLIERRVFGELALVLKISRKTLRARIRAAALGEAAPRSVELAAVEVPPIDGFDAIGAFAVDAMIGIGEAHADVAVPAEPGVWFAYAARDDDADDFSELVGIHATKVGEFAVLRRDAKTAGKAAFEGAHMAIFDEAIVDDREIVDRMLRARCEIVDGRCASLGLGGDGVAEVRVARAGERAICVRVVL
jgi:RNA polymerase-interacting CarD/CdnL/TRCF family regulator